MLLEDTVRAFAELEKIEFQGELLQTYFGVYEALSMILFERRCAWSIKVSYIYMTINSGKLL